MAAVATLVYLQAFPPEQCTPIFLVTAITGCALPAAYEAPQTGPTATLTLSGFKSDISLFGSRSSAMAFAIADEGRCGKYFKPAHATEGESDVEYVIPADRGIFVSYSAAYGTKSCNVNGYFTAADNASYVAKGAIADNGCVVMVFVQREKELRPIDLDTAYRDPWVGLKVCTSESDL